MFKNGLMLLLILVFISCKKQTPPTIDSQPITNEIKPIIIDTNILPGYWKGVKNPNTSKTMYFDENHIGVGIWNGSAGDALFNWHFSSDSTIRTSVAAIKVKKLSKDSLVFETNGYTSRYFRSTTPTTPYSISTLIPSIGHSPNSFALDSDGNIYITGVFGILKGLNNTSSISEWVSSLFDSTGLTIDSSGDIIYVTTMQLGKIDRVSKAITSLMSPGKQDLDNIPYEQSSLGNAKEVAVDHKGNIYIVDGSRVRMINRKTSIIKTIIGGKTYTAQKFNPSPASALDIWVNPTKLSIDNDDNLYMCDSYNNCVWKYYPDERIEAIAGTGKPGYSGDGDLAIKAQLNFPNGIGTDNLGNVFISDNENGAIRKISFGDHKITTIAGYGGVFGQGIDYYNARISGLGRLGSLYVQSNGDIIFIDSGGLFFNAGAKRIRKLSLRNN